MESTSVYWIPLYEILEERGFETITAALEGNYRDEHVFALGQAVELYECYRRLIDLCDTVASALRVMGLANEPHFGNYHRLLNRDQRSPREADRRLLLAIISAFVPRGRMLVVLDDTLERRRGKRIAAKSVYYDVVRSSRSHFAKSTGLRWLCLMVIAEIPFAVRHWALPVLTLLSPSERYDAAQGRRHRKLAEVARGVLLQLARWLPGPQMDLNLIERLWKFPRKRVIDTNYSPTKGEFRTAVMNLFGDIRQYHTDQHHLSVINGA